MLLGTLHVRLRGPECRMGRGGGRCRYMQVLSMYRGGWGTAQFLEASSADLGGASCAPSASSGKVRVPAPAFVILFQK